MVLRLPSIVLFILSVLAFQGCDEDAPALGPNQKLLKSLSEAGFEFNQGKPNTKLVKTMMDYVASECYRVRFQPTDVNLCFHHFKTGIKAIEAKGFIEKTKWPPGRFWTASVWKNSLVHVDSQLKDRPVALKLISFFR